MDTIPPPPSPLSQAARVGCLGRDSSPAPATRGDRRRRPPGAGKAPLPGCGSGGMPAARRTRRGTGQGTRRRHGAERTSDETMDGGRESPPPSLAVALERNAAAAPLPASAAPSAAPGANAGGGGGGWSGSGDRRSRRTAAVGCPVRRMDRPRPRGRGGARPGAAPHRSRHVSGGPRRGAGVVEGKRGGGRDKGKRPQRATVTKGAACESSRLRQQVSAGSARKARDLPAPGWICPAPHGEECRGGESPPRPGGRAGPTRGKGQAGSLAAPPGG